MTVSAGFLAYHGRIESFSQNHTEDEKSLVILSLFNISTTLTLITNETNTTKTQYVGFCKIKPVSFQEAKRAALEKQRLDMTTGMLRGPLGGIRIT